ncbi:MAG: MotA/TolQ/ExbB proton channel family protein [Bryobacterales bacterium]|nr:MotA/TolQ/ExbB proton channel family protein [Bryobacterales bacterium]MDE0628003.1 MotA/TolQ/ExbB proton channel family protein [Bryobacterales bacterium]
MLPAPPFALLLQAIEEEVTEVDPTIAEDVSAAVDQSTLLGLLLEVGPVGFVVFAILVVMSVHSWAVAYSKQRLLSRSDKVNGSFQRAFRRIGSLANINAASERYRPAPLVTVFDYGYAEVARQVNARGRISNSASVERALALAVSEETSRLRKGLSWLATTASAAPFIGLFGTVWGVLEAFRGLGQSSGATLRAVAPGIAEALLATALGLFAAIPALIFYNIHSGKLREIRSRMQDFGLEFFNLAEQDYGSADGTSR